MWQSLQQCEECWVEENGDREPVRMKEEFRENTTCCTCNHMTISGIYVRKDVK